MIELPNLRSNFGKMCSWANQADLETMLAVLADELRGRCFVAARHVQLALDELVSVRQAARARKESPCGVAGCDRLHSRTGHHYAPGLDPSAPA
jgi:hypothetical protein